MGIKDFVYLGLIAISAIVFYLHGLCTARARREGARKLDVPFNDSGCLTELPDEKSPSGKAASLPHVPTLSRAEIRAVFGDN